MMKTKLRKWKAAEQISSKQLKDGCLAASDGLASPSLHNQYALAFNEGEGMVTKKRANAVSKGTYFQ